MAVDRVASLVKRIMAKVTVVGDCWISNASVDPAGFPYMMSRGKHTRVAKLMACASDRELVLDTYVEYHFTCGNQKCVNPRHVWFTMYGVDLRASVPEDFE